MRRGKDAGLCYADGNRKNWKQNSSSPLSFPKPSSRDHLLSSLWHCLPSLQRVRLRCGSDLGLLLSLPWYSFFTCLQPQSPIYTVSLKSLLEMEVMAFPLLASHPISFITKQIDKIKLVAIQANTGDLAIVADLCILDSVLKWRRCLSLDTVPRCLLTRSLWCSLSWPFQLFPSRSKRK